MGSELRQGGDHQLGTCLCISHDNLKLASRVASSPFQLRFSAMTSSNGMAHTPTWSLILNCRSQSYDWKKILWAASTRQPEKEAKVGILGYKATLGSFFITEQSWKHCLALWENEDEPLASCHL